MLGVESITPETLRNYAKKQTFEEIREAAELLKSLDMMVMQAGQTIAQDTPELVRKNQQVQEAYLGGA